MPTLQRALACAHTDLAPDGEIGVVDFCKSKGAAAWFSQWLAVNHVNVDRPYRNELRRLFFENAHHTFHPWAGLWSFYIFVGAHASKAVWTTSEA